MNRILNKKLYIFLSVVFIVFFLQNYMVNTTYPFDTDDWTYIYFSREQPLPLYGSWNPIKVLPEFFQPLFSFIGLMFVGLNNTLSRENSFFADRASFICPLCIGLKLPPKNPTFINYNTSYLFLSGFLL